MDKTPSSLLEHLCTNNDRELKVQYEARGQSHQPLFTAFVSVEGIKGLEATAEGTQKKQAKHRASNVILKLIKERIESGDEWKELDLLDSFDCDQWEKQSVKANEPEEDTFNYVGALTEFCARQGYINPHFESKDIPHETGDPLLKEFQVDCIVHNMKDKSGNFLKTTAQFRQKKVAKRLAAEKMVQLITSMGIDVFARKKKDEVEDDSGAKPAQAPINIPDDATEQLQNYAQGKYTVEYKLDNDSSGQVICVVKAIPLSSSNDVDVKAAQASHPDDTDVVKNKAAFKLLQLLTVNDEAILSTW